MELESRVWVGSGVLLPVDSVALASEQRGLHSSHTYSMTIPHGYAHGYQLLTVPTVDSTNLVQYFHVARACGMCPVPSAGAMPEGDVLRLSVYIARAFSVSARARARLEFARKKDLYRHRCRHLETAGAIYSAHAFVEDCYDLQEPRAWSRAWVVRAV